MEDRYSNSVVGVEEAEYRLCLFAGSLVQMYRYMPACLCEMEALAYMVVRRWTEGQRHFVTGSRMGQEGVHRVMLLWTILSHLLHLVVEVSSRDEQLVLERLGQRDCMPKERSRLSRLQIQRWVQQLADQGRTGLC